jgi:aspartyl-tRNA synthetase
VTTPSFSYRTHTCGALRRDDVGKTVVLLGWVHRVRDLGGLTTIGIAHLARGGLIEIDMIARRAL